MLKDAIARNRFRQSRFKKYEAVLRRLRQRIFDYDDAGKGEKASRLISRCKAICMPLWNAQAETRAKAASDRMMRLWE
jgi:hypothetical protein